MSEEDDKKKPQEPEKPKAPKKPASVGPINAGPPGFEHYWTRPDLTGRRFPTKDAADNA